MRRQGLAPGNDRRDGDWLPVIGEVVCVHPEGGNSYIARVVDFRANKHEGYERYRLRPLFAPRTNDREMHRSRLEPTTATFQGYVCLQCRKGNIR